MSDKIIWLLIGAFSVLIGYIGKMQSDIARINKKLNIIAKKLGEPDTITVELKQLISEGKKVEAIKKYRMASGVGLLEAKEYIDSLNEKEQTNDKSIYNIHQYIKAKANYIISL